MCGIAGILRVHPPGQPPPPPEQAIPESWLDILDESIKHRGPDGHGRFRDRATRPDGSTVDVALVHRRLSIIDPKDGHQPMVSSSSGARRAREGPQGPPESDLVAVIFNGCIYNHRDLRRELTAAGHQFDTDHSDTEVLIHGWREWRHDLLNRLEGMFALVLWDRARGSVVAARDRFGEKPLYGISLQDPDARRANRFDALAYSSALPGLHRLAREFPHNPDDHLATTGLADWLRFGFACSTPSLLHDTIHPCEYFDSNQSPFQQRPYGALALARSSGSPARDQSLSAPVAEALLDRAVSRRLEADVPVGCFLSGGIDSSLIALFAARRLGTLKTFTVRMPDPRHDESKHAEAAARAIGSDHETLECDARPAEDLASLIRCMGLPFGDSSLLPAYWVSRAAGSRVRVALSGDGGDELFGGYERYTAAEYLARFRAVFRLLPGRLGQGSHPKSRLAKVSRLAAAARSDGYIDLLSIFPRPMLDLLLGPTMPPSEYPKVDPGTAHAMARDVWSYLPDDLMRKTDTASMAVPLEVRAPMLDSDLVFATERAPLSDLMPRGQRKGLLRQVASRYLPPQIINRPKQGFAVPVGDWFRTDYGNMKTLLLDHLNSTEPWGSPSLGIDLNMKFVRQMLSEHMNQKRDHSQRLYMLLVLSIWAKSL
jgi:asparagine synthase (glutamine-hydrolysing)